MAKPLPLFWQLDRFGDVFDAWKAAENPSGARRLMVLEWIVVRRDHPFQGMSPQLDIPHLWFGQIPGTRGPDGTVVVCSYFVYEGIRTIKCDILATLSPPYNPIIPASAVGLLDR